MSNSNNELPGVDLDDNNGDGNVDVDENNIVTYNRRGNERSKQRRRDRRNRQSNTIISTSRGHNIEGVSVKKINKGEITEDDIFDTSQSFCFNQIAKEKETIDYVAMCDKVVKKLENPLSVDDPQSIITDVHKLKNKIQQLINIGKCFNKRDLMIGAFANTTKNIIGVCPSTKGEFDRKYLECPRALEDLFDDNVYGNPIGTNIIFKFSSKINPVDIIGYLEKLRRTTDYPLEKRLLFGSYRLDKVYKDDIVVRTEDSKSYIRYVMIMTDVETSISIKCYVMNKIPQTNVRVQTVDYYGEQIFDAIPDLALRRAVLIENLTKYIRKLTETMTRKQRVAVWEVILNVVTKDITYLNQGYKYIDIGENKMIKISYETESECPITVCKPPYMKIHLACGHELSIMAIYGIIYEGESDDTESIKCPQCRSNLIPKLISAIPDHMVEKYTVKSYKEKDLHIDIDDGNFKFEDKENGLEIIKTHNESDKYIDSIFNKDNNDDDDDDDDDEHDNDNEVNINNDQDLIHYLAQVVLNNYNNQ